MQISKFKMSEVKALYSGAELSIRRISEICDIPIGYVRDIIKGNKISWSDEFEQNVRKGEMTESDMMKNEFISGSRTRTPKGDQIIREYNKKGDKGTPSFSELFLNTINNEIPKDSK